MNLTVLRFPLSSHGVVRLCVFLVVFLGGLSTAEAQCNGSSVLCSKK